MIHLGQLLRGEEKPVKEKIRIIIFSIYVH